MYSNYFTEIIPYAGYDIKQIAWHECMACGNGHIGVLTSGAPKNDSFIFQNTEFVMPSDEPRCVPAEVTEQLDEARQSVINMDDTWNIHNRKRTNMYCYHPGHQLRISLKNASDITDFVRSTDYETSELVSSYNMSEYNTYANHIKKRTFTSSVDDVIITEISGNSFTVDISIDDFESMHKFGRQKSGDAPELNMKYTRFATDGLIGFCALYPQYEESELKNGGFAGVTRIIPYDGTTSLSFTDTDMRAKSCLDPKNPIITFSGKKLVLITYLDWTYKQPDKITADFFTIPLVSQCINKINKTLIKYADASSLFSYEAALKPHIEKYSSIFNHVSLKLNNADKTLSNEELLQKQKKTDYILPELLKRVYNHGRYAMYSCAGHTAPRLSGLWTGEWNMLWRSAYTMDANVNIQVSGMNTCGMYDAGKGYIWFVLKQIPDWEINAKAVYGMKNAVLTPVNTDGHRAMMVEYDINYPFQYWNAGASWMIIPIYEFMQVYGNVTITTHDENIIRIYNKNIFRIKEDILLPLLAKTFNFWEQLCTPEYFTDSNGNARFVKGKTSLEPDEKYLIIPSFSPENKPLGYKSAITANAAMDIAAAVDSLNMYKNILSDIKPNGYQKTLEKITHLISCLPVYMFDKSGAIKEWSMNEYKENNAHRHISHLYCAWPSSETQHNHALASACRQAIINRNRENTGKDDTASHGWIHKALVEARLKNPEAVYNTLLLLFKSGIFYNTFFTDHNTDRSKGVFCTDTLLGIVGIINEMLVYSDECTVELLPALNTGLINGEICGLLTKCGIKINRLSWDNNKRSVYIDISALRDTSFNLIYDNESIHLDMKSGEQTLHKFLH